MFTKKKNYLILGIIFGVFALALNVFIIYQACLGSSDSTEWSSPVVEVAADVVNAIKPETITEVNMPDFSTFIRKAIGHYGLFGLDGIFTTLSLLFLSLETTFLSKYKGLWVSLIIGIFIAFLTEFIQLFTPGRSGEVTDALIDSAGFLTSFLIILLIIYIINKQNTKKLAN